MNRRLTVAAALAIAVAFIGVPQASASPWIKSVVEAQKQAKQKNALIFVDMFADWCGWCHRMEQEVFPSQAFQNATDDMVLLRLNTEDGGEGTKLARQFQVSSLPTFLVLSPDMTIAGIIRGYAPSADFVRSLKDVQGKYKDFQTRVKQEPTYAKDYQKRLDLAKEFTQRFALKESESRLKKIIGETGLPPGVRDQAYYELAVSQLLQKKYDESTKTITKFATMQTKGEPYERSRLLLGQIYLEQGNIMGAANEFRSFKQTFPNSPLVQNVNQILPDLERQLSARK